MKLDQIRTLVAVNAALKTLLPAPFPGNRYPTHVAWEAVWRTYDDFKAPEKRFLSYCGKPNIYRANECQNAITSKSGPWELIAWWQAEFDCTGLIARSLLNAGSTFSPQYFAYHPQCGNFETIVTNLLRPVFIKRIGQLPTYSSQKKLSQEQIDRYYAWFEATFVKKLKRPRKAPTSGTTPASDADIHFFRKAAE